MHKLALSCMLLLFIPASYAGGNNEKVKFPANYKTDFTHYHSMNRAGKPQVVDLYANETALGTANSGNTDKGSILIMEIYKAKQDESGNPITGENGLFEKGKFAAVAVMEKQDWDEDYPQAERAGNWGFALYKPDGSPKENELDCATCHTPYEGQDYLFTFEQLK